MALKPTGYSGTPLPRKLGIQEGHKVAILRPPTGFRRTLGEVPRGATLQNGFAGKALLDVIVAFVTRRSQLERQLASIRRRMTPEAGLWVAWPKKSSGVSTDVSETVVREIALATGLVDNKVCAIDATWSGLRLVIRLRNRCGV
jgi:hypothetical protein